MFYFTLPQTQYHKKSTNYTPMNQIRLLTILLFVSFQLSSFAQTNEAIIAYNKGLQHYNSQNYSFALPYFEEAVMESPDFEAAYHVLAISYDESGNKDKAILNYEKLLKINPKQEKVWYNLSILYSGKKDNEKAIKALEEAIAVNPSYGKAHQRLGVLQTNFGDSSVADNHFKNASSNGYTKNVDYSAARSLYKQKKYEEALTKIKKAIKASPSADAYYLLGIIQEKLGNEEEAIEAYDEAIAKNGDLKDAHLNAGIIHYNKEDFEASSGYFEKVAQLDPSDTENQGFLGRAHYSSGRFFKAIEPLELALKADGDNGELHYYLAMAYKASGKQDNLVKSHLERSKEKGFEGAETAMKGENIKHYNNGILAYRAGRYQEAVSHFDNAINEDPNIPKYYYNKGLAYGKSKNYAKAEQSFKAAIGKDEGYGKAHLALANLKFTLGELDLAASSFEDAIRFGMTEAYIYYNLGNTYYNMQNYASASSNYKKAISADPANTDYKYNLGLAYAKDGKFHAAIEEFERVIDQDEKYLVAYYNKGLALVDLESYDKALSVGETIMNLDPDYAKGYLLMAVIYNRKDDAYNQNKYYKMAVKMDPSLKM